MCWHWPHRCLTACFLVNSKKVATHRLACTRFQLTLCAQPCSSYTPGNCQLRPTLTSLHLFFDLADMYDIPCLADVCVDKLISSMNIDNTALTFQVLALHSKDSPNMERHLSKAKYRIWANDELLHAACFGHPASPARPMPRQVATMSAGVQTLEPVLRNSGVSAAVHDPEHEPHH